MNLSNLIKAQIGIIQIISYETMRIHGLINTAANDHHLQWYAWDRVNGLKKWIKNQNCFELLEEQESPQKILEWFGSNEAKNTILLLEDFHPDLSEHQPQMIRKLRNIALKKYKDRTLVLSQPIHCLPKELEKEVHILDFPLPSISDLEAIHKMVCNNYNCAFQKADEEVLQAALGLTIMEAERAFNCALSQKNKLTKSEISIIIAEKEQIIKKSGFLEYYHPTVSLSDIGGLENLKSWLKNRGRGFDKYAKDFGLDAPRGVLLLGIPGTGKSLAAKAIGSEWNFPLLRLDMGRIFGGIVGESEHNIREALKIAEALSPSILWLDEIEKGLSGIQSSGSTDGGTTSRVFGTFLTWMQEKTKPVFVVATANNIAQLPPELLRKGRFDEIFFVDLPSTKARIEILKIHLSRKNRKDLFSEAVLESLAQKSIGFSGAELEEALKEALFNAYDQGVNLKAEHIENAILQTYPLSKIMTDTIVDLRKWANARAKFASDEKFEETAILSSAKENIPKLKQESISNNPFIKE
jgi:SpoVK/Ycf46/Vps4 family AAA+-type ATPase